MKNRLCTQPGHEYLKHGISEYFTLRKASYDSIVFLGQQRAPITTLEQHSIIQERTKVVDMAPLFPAGQSPLARSHYHSPGVEFQEPCHRGQYMVSFWQMCIGCVRR